MRSEILNQLAGLLAHQCFIFASIQTSQFSVASPYHEERVFLE